MSKVIPCGSQSLLERQFQIEYTHAKFQEIQMEFRVKMNCVVDKVFVEGPACRYDIVEETWEARTQNLHCRLQSSKHEH